MPRRYQQRAVSALSQLKLRPFSALRERWREGYSFRDFRSDLMAGLVVGLVAIPLGMALAIASGVPPQHGLYTVIIAGAVIALLGGSRHQVSGPTAAFVVVLVPIVHQFGFTGLLVAGLMAGIILILMGAAGMGRLIQFIPHPVTTGFTTGIALVIATIQLKDFLGLQVEGSPESYIERVEALVHALPSWSPIEAGVATLTFALLLLWPRVSKKVPAPLFALPVVTVLVVLAHKLWPELEIATIASRFSVQLGDEVIRGVPGTLPAFAWPWEATGPSGEAFVLDFEHIKALVPAALSIAVLGAIESLLSAVVADGMAQTQHDPDAELIAQGVGNVIAPFFGGIAATGAIARTATNIRYGARSPLAAVVHAIFVLLALVALAPYVSYLPMAAMAALLILVAYNMSDVKHFWHIVRVAPRSDLIVLLLCFGLTVIFDMVVGVSVGIVLAALLFMRRMAELTSGQPLPGGTTSSAEPKKLPPEILLYRVAGPLFFGAAQSAIGALNATQDKVRVVIFDLDAVPTMDVTGLVALETSIKRLVAHRRLAILLGVHGQPAELIARSGLCEESSKDARVIQRNSLDEALEEAHRFIERVAR